MINSTTSSGNVSACMSRACAGAPAPSTGRSQGARPSPRSILPGCSASRVPNCSATTRGAWLGKHHPTRADPKRGGRIGQVCDQDGGGRAGHCRHAVMLRHPQSAVAESLHLGSDVHRLSQGLGRALTLRPRWRGRGRKEESCVVQRPEPSIASAPRIRARRWPRRTGRSGCLRHPPAHAVLAWWLRADASSLRRSR